MFVGGGWVNDPALHGKRSSGMIVVHDRRGKNTLEYVVGVILFTEWFD